MLFCDANFSEDSNAILKVIEENNKRANEIRNKIVSFQSTSDLPIDFSDDLSSDSIKPADKKKDSVSVDDAFEDEVSFYLDDFRSLGFEFSLDDLINVLPAPSNFNYGKLLMRLSLEAVKEIKEMSEILIDEDDESQKDEIKKYISNEKRKCEFISKLLNDKQAEIIATPKVTHNNIVLAPTVSGNIKVLDDLEHMALEFLPGFRELIESIRNGTFKGIKRFNNNNVLNGICEVRGSLIRILFQRIDRNTYALITAFIKKTTMDKGYQDFIKLRVTDYKLIADKLKKMLDDPEFIKLNEENVSRMDEILGNVDKVPTYKKEVQ